MQCLRNDIERRRSVGRSRRGRGSEQRRRDTEPEILHCTCACACVRAMHHHRMRIRGIIAEADSSLIVGGRSGTTWYGRAGGRVARQAGAAP